MPGSGSGSGICMDGQKKGTGKMTKDTILAKQDLEEKGCTCVLRKGEAVCFSFEHGVKPLLKWIDEGKDFSGCGAADQVIGKAAALLYICLGVKDLYGQVISESALSVLTEHGVTCTYGEKVPYIINRKKNGMCPMEQTVLAISDPAEAVEALKNKVRSMTAEKGIPLPSRI